jgi:hypothetical protein
MDTELRVIVGVSDYELGSCNNQCSHTFVWLHNFNNTRSNIIMTKELNEKKFFIISKEKYIGYRIYDSKSYDLTTAVRKLLALDELKDNKETSYHLQEVNFSMVDKPLKLTEEMEVKEEQSEMPF